MQTIRGQKMIDTSHSGFRSSLLKVPVYTNQEKTSKIREFTSWSVCFAIVSGLTGLMKYLRVGVTMDTVTSILFYFSLAGFIYFIYRIISLSRNPVHTNGSNLHELN